jgi:hypothetical protein
VAAAGRQPIRLTRLTALTGAKKLDEQLTSTSHLPFILRFDGGTAASRQQEEHR